MRTTTTRSILAPTPSRRALRARKLRSAAWWLAIGGFLTWMLFGSGDLPAPAGNFPPAPFRDQSLTPSPGDPFGQVRPPEDPVIVAIIDTGIDTGEFAPILWTNPFERLDGVDNDHDGLIDDIHGYNFAGDNHRIDDGHGHGTHVAGIIRRQLRLREALGVGGRPIQFMILKYFEPGADPDATLTASLRAFRYAIDHGADVINYSGGGNSPSAAEEELVFEAARRGILLVAAAGNESANADQLPFYPAAYGADNILSVGATDAQMHPVASSNYGRHNVDLTAPGESVVSDLPGGREGRMTGTSQATAFVTAAAALIIAELPGRPRPSVIIDRVLATGRHVPHLRDRSRSGAQVDLVRALTQKSSINSAGGLVVRNARRIPAIYFADREDETANLQ